MSDSGAPTASEITDQKKFNKLKNSVNYGNFLLEDYIT
jgi:hypothetical protein